MKKIVGYILGNFKKLPDAHVYTHLNFAFIELYFNGDEYVKFDLQYDEKYLKQVVDLKKENPELKVLITLTSQISNKDNEQHGGYSALCAIKENRERFYDDLLKFLEKYNLDGIDLNWEFPTLTWSKQKPRKDDVSNFDVFVMDLYNKFQGKYIITVAGYVNAGVFFHESKLQDYVEHFNVMCYELGRGAGHECHNAFSGGSHNINKSIDTFLIKENVKPEKYVLGIPCFTRVWWWKHENNGFSNCINQKGIHEIINKYPHRIEYKDEDRIPFLYAEKNGKIIPVGSYEDSTSIYHKAKFIKDLNLGGFAVWCVNDDYDFSIIKLINDNLYS